MAAGPPVQPPGCHRYVGKTLLAPMVRAGTLPLRLLALEHGADIVYGEEIIDRKIAKCQRVVNDNLGTIDFVIKGGKEDTVVFRTCEAEAGRVVFQLGTANAEFALAGALKVCHDVSAIDINMGCPKHFSISGGMGAALLSNKERTRAILTTLRRNLPPELPLTCKIRLLATAEETIDFALLCQSCGVSAIAVHARYAANVSLWAATSA